MNKVKEKYLGKKIKKDDNNSITAQIKPIQHETRLDKANNKNRI